jgi:hypothetical protein
MITLVTGLWNIGRDKLQEGWSRSYQHYLDKFSQLLEVDCNLIIFGDNELQQFVKERRNEKNTQFILRDLSWFTNSEFYPKIQNIRQKPEWYNQVGWLKDSTQAKLDMYNPLVMSKVFLLHDAKLLDKFDSEYMFWIDAGLTNTIHPGYFTHDKVLNKLPKSLGDFNFVCFPYETTTEIHGFTISEMNRLTNSKVNKVARGGFFGGKKEVISEINTIYYQLLSDTLNRGYMGTEESIFTLMVYLYPNLISYFDIEPNGLMGKFFEDIKENRLQPKKEKNFIKINKTTSIDNVGLYVITFNSPKQFETLIQSMLEYDSDFINKPKKFLLDNSTDLTTTPRYKELCEQYGFEHIKKDNLGITRGRVFIAEHFHNTDLSCYYFYEDDMGFYKGNDTTCKNGFIRKVDKLYNKTLEILQKENFDFVKLNFTEFFGSHNKQWAWYNVSHEFRQKHWPNNPKLPILGLDSNSPNLEFKHIQSHKGLPYVSGEIYLSNWPILMTKEGNYKCYIETKFDWPHEQTIMSYVYQETIKNNIKPGLLLATPTEHIRFDFYDSKLRKEC